ncbi:acyl-CoA dehydrogenase family protein [soil metagenome]
MAVLNEEQVMLRDMAAEWVRDRMPITATRKLYGERGGGRTDSYGFDADTYAEMAQMGWTGILVPEAHGGSDFGYRSMGLILQELGRNLAASPLLGSALAVASALRLAGTAEQQAHWLPGIADGSVVGTLAFDEGPHHTPHRVAMTAVAAADGGWTLNGVKRPVQDGIAATLAIVAARTTGHAGERDGLSLFLVDTSMPGITRTPLDQIDARWPAVLTFSDVTVGAAALLGTQDAGAALIDRIVDRAGIGAAAEMLGGATQAFETTLEYMKTRVQFGQLIGSFQALQHRVAEMFGELQLTQSVVEAALVAADEDDADLPALASLAKATAGDTFHRISNEMVQLHGGIGMTHEHDAGLYLKRARVLEQLHGGTAWHRERWGRLNGF